LATFERLLYYQNQGKGRGLSLIPKLKFEHVNLISLSKIQVDLATQVLSSSVGKALVPTGGPEVERQQSLQLCLASFLIASM
jgi:hypothetical protein